MPNSHAGNADIVKALQSGRYSFIDAGCGDGGSMSQLERRFGRTPGLGIDYYMEALETSRKAGFDVMFGNLLEDDLIFPEGCVEFAAAMDVLEHLENKQQAVVLMEKLGRAARDFLLIRHPSFEKIEYLAGMGLKLNWVDWTDHRNMMTLDDYRQAFSDLGWKDYLIIPHMQYTNSHHDSVLPLCAPPDTIRYDPSLHGPKPMVDFDQTVWGKFDIFVRLNPKMDDAVWRTVASVEGWEAHWDF